MDIQIKKYIGPILISLVIFQFLLGSWSYSFSPNYSISKEYPNISPKESDYDPYDDYNRIIKINSESLGSSSFISQYLTGSGTATDPYVFQYHNFKITDDTQNIIISISNIETYLVIKNCDFTCISYWYEFSHTIGCLIQDSSNIRFENCRFSGFKEDIIKIERSNNISIVNCSFESSQSNSISILEGSSILVEKNNFQKTIGIYSWNSDTTIIRENIFDQIARYGINLRSTSYNCLVDNNTISQTEIAIVIDGSKSKMNDGSWFYYGLKDSMVSNNLIEYCSGTGISSNFASNSHFENNSIQFCSEMGIKIEDCINLDIFSNQLHAIGINGINIKLSRDISLKYNQFSDIEEKNINGYYNLLKSNTVLSISLKVGGICGVITLGIFIGAIIIRKKRNFLREQ